MHRSVWVSNVHGENLWSSKCPSCSRSCQSRRRPLCLHLCTTVQTHRKSRPDARILCRKTSRGERNPNALSRTERHHPSQFRLRGKRSMTLSFSPFSQEEIQTIIFLSPFSIFLTQNPFPSVLSQSPQQQNAPALSKTRQVGMIKVPLQIVGVPLNFILSFAPMKLLARIPILDLLLARPISLEKVKTGKQPPAPPYHFLTEHTHHSNNHERKDNHKRQTYQLVSSYATEQKKKIRLTPQR